MWFLLFFSMVFLSVLETDLDELVFMIDVVLIDLGNF